MALFSAWSAMMTMAKAKDGRRTASLWFEGATLVICVAGVYLGGTGRGGGGEAVSLAEETNACNLWSCTTMSVSQASSSKALKTRLDGIKAADEELRAKEAKLEGALEESRKERREEAARAEELQARYASLAAKMAGSDKLKQDLEKVREDDTRQAARASNFEAKYASLASSYKGSSRELVQGEAKLRAEVEGERQALTEALKRGAVEGRLLAKAEEHARTWDTILSAGGVVDWEAKVRFSSPARRSQGCHSACAHPACMRGMMRGSCTATFSTLFAGGFLSRFDGWLVFVAHVSCAQDAKRDRRREKILEAAEYWAAKREDPYVDEFFKAQVARDEAYSNRWVEWLCV